MTHTFDPMFLGSYEPKQWFMFVPSLLPFQPTWKNIPPLSAKPQKPLGKK